MHYLVHCSNGHFWNAEVNRNLPGYMTKTHRIVDYETNSKTDDTPSSFGYCPECDGHRTLANRIITTLDKPYTAVHKKVSVFAKFYVRWDSNCDSKIKHYEKNSHVLQLLMSEGFQADKFNDEYTDCKLFYRRGNDQIVFVAPYCSSLKTTNVYIIMNDSTELVSKLVAANKADVAEERQKEKELFAVESCRDFLGNELQIGDWVAYGSGSYSGLGIAQITKFKKIMGQNNKILRIQIHLKSSRGNRAGGRPSPKLSHQLIKLSEDQITLYLLEN